MAAERPRLLSLDVFRGATIAGMILVNNPGDWGHIYAPLDHAEWHGWTPTDLIFPFFLFITGVSIALSFSSAKTETKSRLYLKILKRSAVLFLLGLFLNGFPFFELSTLRVMGVLQRIALCYLFAAAVYLELGLRGQLGAAAALLLAYWAAMSWIDVPGVGAGSLEKGRNFAAYVDQLVLGRHVWAAGKTWDPEGLVSTLPAISTTLFGVFTGAWLRTGRSQQNKALGLLGAGAAGLIIGSIWSHWLPINKNLWTSSYAVFMSGFALAALAACYYLIEIKKSEWWTQPFVVFGKNSIAVFVLSGIVARILIHWKVPFHGKSSAVKTVLFRTLFTPRLSPFNASLAYALAFILVFYLLMLVLYRRRIFIKI